MNDNAPRADITTGMRNKLTDDQLDNLAAALAQQAVDAAGGYVWAASTLIRAAGVILITKLPPADAVKMLGDLSTFWIDTVNEKLIPPGGVRQ